MLSRQTLTWLRREIPQLVADNVISPFQGDLILHKYTDSYKKTRRYVLYCLGGVIGLFLAIIILFIFI